MKPWQKNRCTEIAALLLGGLLTFAFAPYEIFPLAILCPAGLIALWLETSPRRALWLGWLFGVGYFGTGVYWVYICIHIFGDIPYLLAGLITSGFIAALAFAPAFVGYLVQRYFASTSHNYLYTFAALWVGMEWVRSWLFGGFPWLFLGYSQTNSLLKGFAPILGVYGVSLAVMVTSVLLVDAILRLKHQRWTPVFFNIAILVIIWTSGALLCLVPWTHPSGEELSVSLVQGAIPQTIKWSPEHVQLSLDRYEQLTEPLWAKDRLIIWPETAIPLTYQEANDYVELLAQKAKNTGSTLILGILQQSKEPGRYYNSIMAFNQDRNVYLKTQLVPFGEYTPMESTMAPLMKYLNIPMSALVPGPYNQAPFNVNNVKILPSICYEIAYPEFMNTDDRSVGMLLTLTNDAWYGKSAEQAQHLQIAQMRALELRRPVLMVTNDGLTALIGPNGNIESSAPPYETYVLNTTVQAHVGLTPWMRNGVDPVLFILISIILSSLYYKRRTAVSSRQSPITSPNTTD